MKLVRPTLSIVVPLYNSAATLPRLLDELCAMQVEGGLEIVLVNDGSRDETERVAVQLIESSNVPVIFFSLSRNFGEHNAVMHGLRAARGEFVITMDDDLQNPPSEALKLLRVAQTEQRDVVYSVYDQKRHAWWRNLGSGLTNLIADWAIEKPKGLYLSSFRCISRFVVDEIARSQNPYPYIDALIFQVTQNVGVVTVRHDARTEGESGYTMRKLLRLWMSMLVNASIMPLRFAAILGVVMSSAGLIAFIYVLANHFMQREPLGWSSLMCALLIFSGAQLLLLGIVGEYIGRIFLHVSDKPQAIVRHRIEHMPDALTAQSATSSFAHPRHDA